MLFWALLVDCFLYLVAVDSVGYSILHHGFRHLGDGILYYRILYFGGLYHGILFHGLALPCSFD